MMERESESEEESGRVEERENSTACAPLTGPEAAQDVKKTHL